MWKAPFALAAALAAGLGQSAQAQQSCNCPKPQVCQCVSKSGGIVWTAPSGSSTTHHMPVPVETLLAGMTYTLKPEAEKQAYLMTLSSQDRQFILENASTLTASVQNLQADHQLYRQEMRLKSNMTPQLQRLNSNRGRMLNKVATPN